MKKICLLLLLCMVTACNASKVEHDYPVSGEDARRASRGKILGEDALSFGGGSRKKASKSSPSVQMVANPHLWRASLDVVAHLPVMGTDPIGGVILTDWYQHPDSPGERFKLNIFILDHALRADSLRVSVFKQVGPPWQDAAVKSSIAMTIENRILTRARELRIMQTQ
jgi:hypothetical protein